MSADALPSHYVHQLMYRERWCYLSLLPGPHLQARIKPLCTIAEHFFFIAVQCQIWHSFLILAYIGLVNIRIFKNGTISLLECLSDQGNHRLTCYIVQFEMVFLMHFFFCIFAFYNFFAKVCAKKAKIFCGSYMHYFAAQVPLRPREPQTSTFTEKIAQFGVLDVFISAFLWVLLKLIVRAFRPRDHDRAADDLSLPLCAKPSTSSYNHCPIVFVFRIVISSFLCYGQYLCFMILDPSRKYN